ncbi:hypothetical protein AK812_SmicGene1517 [Symbiodinium microadriaticum]|uniref:Uncharacterized protein n=1 Tax=Symbiodinium microadriaticum TaxID=2951 RepID=A0A1Q9F3W9_SYMMI|nr:hypothetical protein AK812_SmicGene1517 [Symbiodinium microadriaticum]
MPGPMNSMGPGTMDLRGPGPMPGPMNSMGPGTMDLRGPGLMPGPMDSMGPGTMDLRGPSPMASRAPNSPFSSVRGPPMTMVPAPLPPPATVLWLQATARQPMSPEQYAVVQKELNECLDAALMKRKELVQSLDQVTNSQSPAVGTQVTVSRYDQPMSKAAAHNLDQVDWRVPRLMYCLDPKYNTALDPAIAFEVQQKKSEDGQMLQKQLSSEVTAQWAEKMREIGLSLPVQERVVRGGVPFAEASPSYHASEDVWGRTLELRTIDEALHGDVSKPLPRPVLFPEEYQNFKQGKYVRDDCPIT